MIEYNNSNKVNPIEFVKLKSYLFKFLKGLDNNDLIELKEIVKNGKLNFENIHLKQKERYSKTKLSIDNAKLDPYYNEVLRLYNAYSKLLIDIENKLSEINK